MTYCWHVLIVVGKESENWLNVFLFLRLICLHFISAQQVKWKLAIFIWIFLFQQRVSKVKISHFKQYDIGLLLKWCLSSIILAFVLSEWQAEFVLKILWIWIKEGGRKCTNIYVYFSTKKYRSIRQEHTYKSSLKVQQSPPTILINQ